MKKYYLFIAALIIFCSVAIVNQVIRSRGPVADRKTVNDLSDIQNKIEDYARTNRRLPVAISSLDGLSNDVVKRAQKYDYNTLSTTKYKLCAVFVTDASKGAPSYRSSYSRQSAQYHKKGYQCFENQVYSIYDDYGNPSPSIHEKPSSTSPITR